MGFSEDLSQWTNPEIVVPMLSLGIARWQGVAMNATKGKISVWPAAYEGRIIINGIEYTQHALERMQPVETIIKGKKLFSWGVPVSVVENAIEYGEVTSGNTIKEVVRTFENVRIITNPQGTRVISVIKIGR